MHDQKEIFITDKCLRLFEADTGESALRAKIKNAADVHIDLHTEKWGEVITDKM